MLVQWVALEALDVGIAAFLAAVLVLTAWRVTSAIETNRKWRERQVALAYLVFAMGVSGVTAASGLLRDFAARPPRLILVLLPITVTTIVVALSPLGRRIATQAPLWALIGFQSFRVLVEILLWGIHRLGAIPVQMTFEGYNFDVLTGLTAIGVALVVRAGRLSNRALWFWNVGGLVLLINIVTIAVLSMPTPLRTFLRGPANTIVAEFPFVWIPTVMVQAALFGHIVLFRALRIRAGAVTPIPASQTTRAA